MWNKDIIKKHFFFCSWTVHIICKWQKIFTWTICKNRIRIKNGQGFTCEIKGRKKCLYVIIIVECRYSIYVYAAIFVEKDATKKDQKSLHHLTEPESRCSSELNLDREYFLQHDIDDRHTIRKYFYFLALNTICRIHSFHNIPLVLVSIYVIYFFLSDNLLTKQYYRIA